MLLNKPDLNYKFKFFGIKLACIYNNTFYLYLFKGQKYENY